jgi:HK97 family phage prohead protease
MTVATTATRRGAERRTVELADLEMRTTADGRLEFTGYGAVFGVESRGLKVVERIMPGAFTDTLAAGPDVRFLAQHDPSTVMARTTAGDLFLTEDGHGLLVRALLDPEDVDVQRLATKVKNRHITGMSFAFWVMPGGEERVEVNGVLERHLTRLDIDGGDVASVTYPAYPDTDGAEIRSAEIINRFAELAGERCCTRSALEELPDDLDLDRIRTVVERLESRAAGLTNDDLVLRLARAVDDVLGGETYNFYYWIRDVADDWLVIRVVSYMDDTPLDGGFWQAPYTVDAAGNVTLGAWIEVLPRTTYDPAPPSTDPEEVGSGDTPSTMSIDEARTQARMRRRH